MDKFKMFINGSWVDSSNNQTIDAVNPATGKIIGTFPKATKEDVQLALDSAQGAREGWASKSIKDRAALLNKAADIFDRHHEELGTLQSCEMGKQISMAIGEASSIADLFRESAAAGLSQTGSSYPNISTGKGNYGELAFSVTEPLGVVACIAPFNFPVGCLTFKVAPALMMGNVIIIKPASDCTLTIIKYVECLVEAGFPENVIQLVTGSGKDVGDWLVDNDQIDAIGFTGSTEVGMRLYEKSSKYLHRLLLELGGNDPFIITSDADLDAAAGESAARMVNAGQVCCTSKRFIVHNSIKSRYVEKLKTVVESLPVGDPLDEKILVGPLVSESAAKSVEEQVNSTLAAGGVLICGGKRNGAFYEPTVIDNVTADMPVAKDMEIFGPVWPVIGYDTIEEAIEIANQTVYGLNAGVLAGKLEDGIKIASKLKAGTVVTNGSSLWRANNAPFGGYKRSGIGREGIENLLEEFSQKKTLVIKGV